MMNECETLDPDFLYAQMPLVAPCVKNELLHVASDEQLEEILSAFREKWNMLGEKMKTGPAEALLHRDIPEFTKVVTHNYALEDNQINPEEIIPDPDSGAQVTVGQMFKRYFRAIVEHFNLQEDISRITRQSPDAFMH